MAQIPIADAREAVKALLTEVLAGIEDFSKATCRSVRVEEATFTLEAVFDGDEIIESRQSTTQDGGDMRTTTTEQPFSQYTETVKSGSYTQSGTNTSTQGGGSSEETEYTYDEVS